jgi:hypothetical protein
MLIGFIGAPSCGKTTTAIGLVYRLKKEGFVAEFIPEAARQQIIECRAKGIEGNGGPEGQKKIYATDKYLHELYRDHSSGFSITDGSTVNCHFYGLEEMDLVAECGRYDLQFYIPLTDTPYQGGDQNRIQNHKEIIAIAKGWEEKIPPLQQQFSNIITLQGYPLQTQDQMVEAAYTHLQRFFLTAKQQAA